MQNKLDYYLIGPISIDSEQLPGSAPRKFVGGALPFGAYAALAGGRKVGALANMAASDHYLTDLLYLNNVSVVSSRQTTSFHNLYETADRERRSVRAAAVCDAILAKDLPAVDALIYHLAGLSYGDFDHELFPMLAQKGQLACDLQGFLRHVIDDVLIYKDWPEKLTYIPYITYLKADAAEAEVITGKSDRREAAEQLHQWGAKEIMITYKTDVLIYDGSTFYTCPIRSRNFTGRSGRGDTTFASYITERIDHSIEEALFYATSLVSLKMETPGPFKGTRADVKRYQQECYSDYLQSDQR